MEQLPWAIALRLFPATVQIAGVEDAKVTGKVELAVAAMEYAAEPVVCVGTGEKVMVWAERTEKDTVTGAAGVKLVSPAWVAVIEQLPRESSVADPAATVQTEVEFDAKATGK